MELVSEQNEGSRLGDFLRDGLGSDALSFRGAVAFVRASGMAHLQPLISDFSKDRPFEMIVGIDLKGSTVEGLQMLLDSLGEKGQAFVFHNNGRSTFHPKMFRFVYTNRTEFYVGSGNLTAGGLFTNHEAGIHLREDTKTGGHSEILGQFETALDNWSVNGGAASLPLDSDLISALVDRRMILSEAAARASLASKMSKRAREKEGASAKPLFGSARVAPGPEPLVNWAKSVATEIEADAEEASDSDLVKNAVKIEGVAGGGNPRYFVMTLQKTDVGRGQTTSGAAARSPEVFVPLAARDLYPDFWSWPDSFNEDPDRAGKFDRIGVPFIVNGHPSPVNMMTWPVKHDFRLRSEALRSGGNIGDILLLERTDTQGLEYLATFVRLGTAQHAELLERCNNEVRNSTRRFGYY